MNLLCDVSMFQSNHICFLDTKKNMVIDGFFTKIIYSDSYVSLNGLYILCPLESLSIPVFPIASSNGQYSHRFAGISSGSANYTRNHVVSTYQENGQTIITKKHIFMFSLTNPTNIHFVKELNRIEHEIIEFYKDFFKINKVNVYSLRNQLKSGNIKVIQRIESDERSKSPSSLVIKISGIWETEINVGITFKFQM